MTSSHGSLLVKQTTYLGPYIFNLQHVDTCIDAYAQQYHASSGQQHHPIIFSARVPQTEIM